MTLIELLLFLFETSAIALLGALLIRLFRLRSPTHELIVWQSVLVLLFVLPASQLTIRSTAARVSRQSFHFAADAIRTSAPLVIRHERAILGILVLGMACRMIWLIGGLSHIGKLRRTSVPVGLEQAHGRLIEIRLTNQISGAVSFGLTRPVILAGALWKGA